MAARNHQAQPQTRRPIVAGECAGPGDLILSFRLWFKLLMVPIYGLAVSPRSKPKQKRLTPAKKAALARKEKNTRKLSTGAVKPVSPILGCSCFGYLFVGLAWRLKTATTPAEFCCVADGDRSMLGGTELGLCDCRRDRCFDRSCRDSHHRERGRPRHLWPRWIRRRICSLLQTCGRRRCWPRL